MADNPNSTMPTEGITLDEAGSDPGLSMSEVASAEDIVKKAKEEIEKAMSKAVESAQGAGQNPDYEEVVEYFDPIQDPYNKAIKYLEQHDILQLFQSLTTNIVYHKPTDPLTYMLQEIQTIKQERSKTQKKS